MVNVSAAPRPRFRPTRRQHPRKSSATEGIGGLPGLLGQDPGASTLSPPPLTPLLTVEGLWALTASTRLRGVSFHVGVAEKSVTLIGANGAGKSSILQAISGMLPVAAAGDPGRPRPPGGRPTSGWPGASPTSRRAGHLRQPDGPGKSARLATLPAPGQVQHDLEEVFQLFPRLATGGGSGAIRCPAASSRCWRLGRALMSRARLLLLDEPSMGLAPLL